MSAKGYTNKDAIEKYMLIDIDDSFDEQIDEWIQAVEEYIDGVTNRDYSVADEDAETSDRTFDGDGTSTLDIDPAVEIEEVRFSETATPVDEDNYILYPIRKDTTTKIKLRYLKFPKGLQNIYVKANWGYATVPMSIKLAATILVTGIINYAWNSDGEVQSMTIGRYSVSYKDKSQLSDFDKVDDMLLLQKKFSFGE